jgi:hypothetical protein
MSGTKPGRSVVLASHPRGPNKPPPLVWGAAHHPQRRPLF